jgi:hypothetical protein
MALLSLSLALALALSSSSIDCARVSKLFLIRL